MNRNTRAGIAAGTLAGISSTLTMFAQWFVFDYPRSTASFLILWLVIPSLFIVLGAGVGALFGGVIGTVSNKIPVRSNKRRILTAAGIGLISLAIIIPFQILRGRPIIAGIFPVVAVLVWTGIFFPCFDKWAG